jgi:hypothetical protein
MLLDIEAVRTTRKRPWTANMMAPIRWPSAVSDVVNLAVGFWSFIGSRVAQIAVFAVAASPCDTGHRLAPGGHHPWPSDGLGDFWRSIATPPTVRDLQGPLEFQARGLRQRSGGVLLLAFENRDVPSPRIRQSHGGTDRRDGIHRVLVRPAPAPCQQPGPATSASHVRRPKPNRANSSVRRRVNQTVSQT